MFKENIDSVIEKYLMDYDIRSRIGKHFNDFISKKQDSVLYSLFDVISEHDNYIILGDDNDKIIVYYEDEMFVHLNENNKKIVRYQLENNDLHIEIGSYESINENLFYAKGPIYYFHHGQKIKIGELTEPQNISKGVNFSIDFYFVIDSDGKFIIKGIERATFNEITDSTLNIMNKEKLNLIEIVKIKSDLLVLFRYQNKDIYWDIIVNSTKKEVVSIKMIEKESHSVIYEDDIPEKYDSFDSLIKDKLLIMNEFLKINFCI